MEKKQTAVDLLVSILNKDGFAPVLTDEEIQQAKQMEKEQIEDAWDKRCSYGVVSQTWRVETTNGELYYNETYGKTKN
jgi:hypothetical protein